MELNPFKNYVVLAIIILAILLLIPAHFIAPNINNSTIVIREGALQKNSQLMLADQDIYTYNYAAENMTSNITYTVTNVGPCLMLGTNESAGACLDPITGEDPQGMNSSLNDSTLFIYAPWMLAVHDGWTWNVTVDMSMGNQSTPVSEIDYQVIRDDTYMNRSVYVVEVIGDGSNETYWIDQQRRIALEIQGSDFIVQLINMSRQ